MKKILIVALFFVSFAQPAQAITEQEMMVLLEEIKTQLLVLQAEETTLVADADMETTTPTVLGATLDTPLLTIVMEGVVHSESAAATAVAAQAACEAVAYDTDFMWNNIECVYDGALIYSGVFIAG